MRKHTFVPVALLSLAFAADAAPQSAVPDTTPAIGPARPDIFKHIIANQKKGEAALDFYERIERVETRKDKNIARHSFGDGHVPDSRRRRWQTEGFRRVSRRSRESGAGPGFARQ